MSLNILMNIIKYSNFDIFHLYIYIFHGTIIVLNIKLRTPNLKIVITFKYI